MLKKSMDVVDTYVWTSLHSEDLKECFVDNAYRLKYSWLLKIRCKGSTKLLKVEPGQRIHISVSEPGEKSIDNVARYLRAHVRDGKIVSVEMPWWERIVVIKALKGSKELVNYVELLPRGLWVLTDATGKVIYSSRFEEFKDRTIKPGLQYQPPPVRGLPPWNVKALVDAVLKGKDLVRGLVSEWGLPGYIAEELLLRTGLYEDKLKKPTEIPKYALEELARYYVLLVTESLEGKGYLVYGNKGIEFYSPYKPRLFAEIYGLEVKEVGDFDSAIDAYFTDLEAYFKSEEERMKAEKQAEMWKKSIEEQKKAIEEYRKELERVTKALSLIYENYYTVLGVLECARKTRVERGWQYLAECNVVEYDERRGTIKIKTGDNELELSIREDLDNQVLRLEKRRGELQKKIERALEALKALENKSIELEKRLAHRIHAKPPPRYWYDKFRWSLTRNNLIVVAGRDAAQNELLVKKYLGEDDVFLHANVHGAPATVMLRNRAELNEDDIADAAVIAACYSKAWKAGYSYVEVYWVKGRQVSKSPPSGEYLSKGAFMVYGERNYLRVPLRLGIGLRVFCDSIYGAYVKVYAASPELVKKTCVSYVIVVPGDVKPVEAAGEIVGILVNKALEKTGTRYVLSEQQVLDVLPGPLRVVEYGIGEGPFYCEE
ncbi:MAG: ribosome rescue protein RqcH [Desulfurococcaceae archaeon]